MIFWCCTVTLLSEPDDSSESTEEYIEDDALANNMVEDIGLAPDDESISIQNASEKSLILVKWIILFLLTLQSAYQLSSAALNCTIF